VWFGENRKPMRILLLSQLFQPESFFKGLPFAKALRERGHDVEVLTGFPNYPGGRIYPGYRMRLYQREIMDGITVHRVPLYPSHDKSAFHRILNYISFSLSAFLLGPWFVQKANVIYVYNLITLGPPAFLLRLLFGAKVIIDIQDLWPESVANSNMLRNKAVLYLLNKICNRIYRRTDHLAVLSPGFKQELVSRGIPSEKIDVIYNWCDEFAIERHDLSVKPAKPPYLNTKFVVLFAGSMGILQGLDTLLDCARLCEESLPDVQFVLIGGGVDRPRLQMRSKKIGLRNLVFLPPRSTKEMGEIYSLADALLVHLVDDPIFRITIPSKTQAYLYVGKPIIMAMRGNAGDMVRDSGAGIVCEPEDPKAMVKAIQRLREMTEDERQVMGSSGYRYYREHLSFNQGVEKFEKIMMLLSRKGV
jgi:colanic acid biosynthesis glycosyl transferase WcaI